MKTSVPLVTCFLLFSSLAVLTSQSSPGPTECCFRFVTTRLPKNNVVSYTYTDERCAKKAVIFTMKKGVICADPSAWWVKNIIEAKGWAHTKSD